MSGQTAALVPLPFGRGFCTTCAADVPVPPNGRCSQCSTLLIWRSDRPRPPIVTETYLRALEATREIPDQPVDVPAATVNLSRQPQENRRLVRRPLGPDGLPRWSMSHDRCIHCGTTNHAHSGGGVCKPCRSTLTNQTRKERRLAIAGLEAASTSANSQRPANTVTC